MTGKIVFVRYTGWGEIRSPASPGRIPFWPGALVDLAITDALGVAVEFDTAPAKSGGIEAVRVRRARSERGAA